MSQAEILIFPVGLFLTCLTLYLYLPSGKQRLAESAEKKSSSSSVLAKIIASVLVVGKFYFSLYIVSSLVSDTVSGAALLAFLALIIVAAGLFLFFRLSINKQNTIFRIAGATLSLLILTGLIGLTILVLKSLIEWCLPRTQIDFYRDVRQMMRPIAYSLVCSIIMAFVGQRLAGTLSTYLNQIKRKFSPIYRALIRTFEMLNFLPTIFYAYLGKRLLDITNVVAQLPSDAIQLVSLPFLLVPIVIDICLQKHKGISTKLLYFDLSKDQQFFTLATAIFFECNFFYALFLLTSPLGPNIREENFGVYPSLIERMREFEHIRTCPTSSAGYISTFSGVLFVFYILSHIFFKKRQRNWLVN